jgi:vancomycin resistance protein YoaR
MTTLNTLTEKHNLISETKFQLKSFLLIVRRQFQNTFADTKKFADKGQLKSQPIISVSESNLWNIDDNEQNWVLTAGKVQNLRLAAKRLNGIEVEANKPFSFWKHLGNPNIGKGYVIGREIREGCIVPTIAGGLCQLSNALYDAALKANFEIIERHRHTKVIKGSLAEQDRDATV